MKVFVLFDVITTGSLMSMHKEVIKLQRWDISYLTRETLYICLN
jgi:hypothetical protein